MVEWRAIITCVDSILGKRPNFPVGTELVLMNHSFFYKHELLMKYEWYWRVEPEIKYFCDIT